MVTNVDEPRKVYARIAQEYDISWVDRRGDREITRDGDSQEENDGGNAENDYTESDEEEIWRDIGTGSRSGGGDNYEDEYREFTDAQIGKHANDVLSESSKSCRTYFDPKDAPEDKRGKFEWLLKLNDGVRENWWGQYKEWKETLRDAEYFASRMGLPEYQVQEVVLYTKQLDFQGGRRKEHLILALISLVADRYTEDFDNRISGTTMFHVFLDSVGMDKGDLMGVRQTVRGQVPL